MTPNLKHSAAKMAQTPALKQLTIPGPAPSHTLTLSWPEQSAPSELASVVTNPRLFSTTPERHKISTSQSHLVNHACLRCAQSAVLLHSSPTPPTELTFSTFSSTIPISLNHLLKAVNKVVLNKVVLNKAQDLKVVPNKAPDPKALKVPHLPTTITPVLLTIKLEDHQETNHSKALPLKTTELVPHLMAAQVAKEELAHLQAPDPLLHPQAPAPLQLNQVQALLHKKTLPTRPKDPEAAVTIPTKAVWLSTTKALNLTPLELLAATALIPSAEVET